MKSTKVFWSKKWIAQRDWSVAKDSILICMHSPIFRKWICKKIIMDLITKDLLKWIDKTHKMEFGSNQSQTREIINVQF